MLSLQPKAEKEKYKFFKIRYNGILNLGFCKNFIDKFEGMSQAKMNLE